MSFFVENSSLLEINANTQPEDGSVGNLLMQPQAQDSSSHTGPFRFKKLLQKDRLQYYDLRIRKKSASGNPVSERIVKPPPFHFYADPFLHERDGQLQVFFEDYDYRLGRGHLSTFSLDEDFKASKPVTILAAPYHLSYPSLFTFEDRLYMVPEMSESNEVCLFECVDYPQKWLRVNSLLRGIDAADSTVFFHEGRFWLFTSIRKSRNQNRYLGIFSSDSLVSGDWIPHPVNNEQRYQSLAFHSGRCAGPILRLANMWVRPCQYNVSLYGESILLQGITHLSLTDFSEVSIGQVQNPSYGHYHHFSQTKNFEVVDMHRPLNYCTSALYSLIRKLNKGF